MATLKIPQTRFISNVQLLIGRLVVTTKSGKTHSYRYEQLTPAQETKLRSLAPSPLVKRRELPKQRPTGKPRQSTNYAELATKSILINANSNFYGILEVQNV